MHAAGSAGQSHIPSHIVARYASSAGPRGPRRGTLWTASVVRTKQAAGERFPDPHASGCEAKERALGSGSSLALIGPLSPNEGLDNGKTWGTARERACARARAREIVGG